MRFKFLVLLFICFSKTASSQNFPKLTEEQYAIRSKLAFEGAKASFNMPKHFHKIRMTDVHHDLFLDKAGALIATFYELMANKDTSVVIGVYVFGHYGEFAKDRDMILNSKRGLYYVDTLVADFIRYNKEQLAAWHTDFGVEYTIKDPRLFMNRFTNARMVKIADFNRELRIVYFFTENQRKNIEAIIQKTKMLVTPIEN